MAEDSSSEDDYMSDKLLVKAEQVVRVGLPLKKAEQRVIEMAKRKAKTTVAARTKKRHVIEEEQRNEGLSKPIDASNKGFALLSAMGFKPGMTLGIAKSTPNSTDGPAAIGASSTSSGAGRLIEPLAVTLKTDGRGGLGLAADKEEKAKERLKAHLVEAVRREDPRILTDEFRRKKRSDFELKAIREDLARSRRVCRQMDLDEGLADPENKLFWPPPEPADDEDVVGADDSDASSDDDIPDDDVILRDLTEHLRTKYFYCIWCGCRYRDAQDLAECPGGTRESHEDD